MYFYNLVNDFTHLTNFFDLKLDFYDIIYYKTILPFRYPLIYINNRITGFMNLEKTNSFFLVASIILSYPPPKYLSFPTFPDNPKY